MSNTFQRTYWANDVAELLGISTSALRKWSLRLESQGYSFIRDEHDRRAYRDSDLVALRKMKEFLDNKMSMENAAKAVYTLYSSYQNTSSGTGIVPAENQRSEERYLTETKFHEFMQQQQAFNQTLIEELQKRDQYIETTLKSIEERVNSRDDRLMETMNAVLETKRLLAVAEEQPKKKWYQFWK